MKGGLHQARPPYSHISLFLLPSLSFPLSLFHLQFSPPLPSGPLSGIRNTAHVVICPPWDVVGLSAKSRVSQRLSRGTYERRAVCPPLCHCLSVGDRWVEEGGREGGITVKVGDCGWCTSAGWHRANVFSAPWPCAYCRSTSLLTSWGVC